MSHLISHKGYHATRIEQDEDGVYWGLVADLSADVIQFEGKTLEEAHQSFRDSVDDYLESCAKLGHEADKPFNGELTLKLDTHLHRELVRHARRESINFDDFVTEALQQACQQKPKAESEQQGRKRQARQAPASSP